MHALTGEDFTPVGTTPKVTMSVALTPIAFRGRSGEQSQYEEGRADGKRSDAHRRARHTTAATLVASRTDPGALATAFCVTIIEVRRACAHDDGARRAHAPSGSQSDFGAGHSCGDQLRSRRGFDPPTRASVRAHCTGQSDYPSSRSASELAFTVQPAATFAGMPINSPVQVTVQDSLGQTVTTTPVSVTLTLASGETGILQGTLIAATVPRTL